MYLLLVYPTDVITWLLFKLYIYSQILSNLMVFIADVSRFEYLQINT